MSKELTQNTSNAIPPFMADYDPTDFIVEVDDASFITEALSKRTEEYLTSSLDTNIGREGVTVTRDLSKYHPMQADFYQPWDPRLARVDYFVANNGNGSSLLVPFATNTGASCFSDMIFSLDKHKIAELKKESKASDQDVESGDQGLYDTEDDNVYPITSQSQVELWNKNTDVYGLASLMNPYSITRLVGSLDSISLNSDNKTVNIDGNYMLDIRDARRFYDTTTDTENGVSPLAISDPTTSNIIKWSNSDRWGRTPYSFQDFVFCKWWNIIPNNRLLTLRKYLAPTLDNLNFEGMQDNTGDDAGSDVTFSPVATVVSYFGEGTENSLGSLLGFSSGTKWSELEAKIWDVTGNEGSTPEQVVDDTINSNESGWGTGIFRKLSGSGMGLSKKILSLNKFLGLGDSSMGFSAEAANAQHLQQALMDPYEDGPYANRIQGPVNRIDKVMKRDPGIEWSNSMTVTCQYVSRPIGGINTKAAMLDILSNCLEMASTTAVFWGGGHRFEIEPKNYPWTGHGNGRGVMKKLYRGEIFGKDGAISDTMQGITSYTRDADGNISWGAFSTALTQAFGETLGAIGQMVSSLSESIMGKSVDILGMMGVEQDSSSAIQAGKNRMMNLFKNTENLWKSEMIKNTVYPSVKNNRAILIGTPVGNWHLTIGNPLNPIAVIGNLICDKMEVTFGEDLGPDDFPLEMTVKYTLKHGMARDLAAIESMFNRGAGKIYNLPDYLRASSDLETKVDKFTGGAAFRAPEFIGPTTYGLTGKKSYSLDSGRTPSNSGNWRTTVVPKFTPVNYNPDVLSSDGIKPYFIANSKSRATYRANLGTRKMIGNT